MARRTEAELDELIEEATVDAYNEEEQLTGFECMLEEHLMLPFDTEVLGVPVTVVSVELTDSNRIVAVCRRGQHTQRLPIEELPLPDPPPEGADWIAAYRRWRGG